MLTHSLTAIQENRQLLKEVVDADEVAALTDLLKTRVGEGLLQFYNFMEREQGFVQIDDGRGNIEERPLMQVEIAAGE